MESLFEFNLTLRSAFSDCQELGFINLDKLVTATKTEQEVRKLVSIATLRDAGSFFTPEDLSDHAISLICDDVCEKSIVVDPTVGSGNLLVSASKQLPVYSSLSETLRLWGRVLHGFDTQNELVICARIRLIFEAIRRGARPEDETLADLEALLSGIRQSDALEQMKFIGTATHVLLNPPYVLMELVDCKWAKGSANSAAFFVDEVLQGMQPGAKFVGILPDVLRSGTRYKRWRERVSAFISGVVEVKGQFNSFTDVDVFVLHGDKVMSTVGLKTQDLEWLKPSIEDSVSKHFQISIGPLVSYRDPEEGPWAPYLNSRSISPWSVIDEVREKRRTRTRLVLPPFVVVKRTSRPNAGYRAIGAIVKGKASVALENHLIVLKPVKGGLKSCKKLIEVLKSSETNEFLDERIRCRHLTVGAVGEIPWIQQ
ncbi:MAG: hypothetical protein ACJAR0_002789 [Candidatus Azotimanducaceae bacterium]